MLLSLKNVHKSFKNGEESIEVLKGIDLDIEKGSVNVMLGPSGSGKSTLLNIIGAIEPIDSGSVVMQGETLEKMKEKALTEYRRKYLGYVFQSYNLIQSLTVRENIEVGAYLGSNPLNSDDLIKSLGLWDHKDKFPVQLSGGQMQRTSIGRAIIKNPALLLCDEPTGALDYGTSKEIIKLLEDINEEYKTTILMVTHNTELAKIADRIVTLHDGKIGSDVKNEEKIDATKLNW
ncbi:ABC transporter, ATP-binding protein [Eubacterium saphenum ATCC 49989]|nr:ABC transporter, ATP-binding protein [Eubacterium saphenum ATCC 49989]